MNAYNNVYIKLFFIFLLFNGAEIRAQEKTGCEEIKSDSKNIWTNFCENKNVVCPISNRSYIGGYENTPEDIESYFYHMCDSKIHFKINLDGLYAKMKYELSFKLYSDRCFINGIEIFSYEKCKYIGDFLVDYIQKSRIKFSTVIFIHAPHHSFMEYYYNGVYYFSFYFSFSEVEPLILFMNNILYEENSCRKWFGLHEKNIVLKEAYCIDPPEQEYILKR